MRVPYRGTDKQFKLKEYKELAEVKNHDGLSSGNFS